MDRWTDDRLDEMIDAAARRMTAGAPRPGLASRVAARLERRRSFMAPAWQLASAAIVVIAIAVFALIRLWPAPAPERAAAPPVAPISRPATPMAPSTTVVASATPSSIRQTRPPRRPVQTMVIERRGDDIAALDGPAALAIDATPVEGLRVAPLNVQELSVAPLETDPDRKPQ